MNILGCILFCDTKYGVMTKAILRFNLHIMQWLRWMINLGSVANPSRLVDVSICRELRQMKL